MSILKFAPLHVAKNCVSIVQALVIAQVLAGNPAPYPGEHDADDSRIGAPVHMGTVNFAAIISVPAALDLHQHIGGAAKGQRLRHLHALWSEPARQMPHIEVLGGLDTASRCGLGAFRLRGETGVPAALELQQRLEQEFGIFTAVRDGLTGGACIRVTPQVFTTAAEISRFVAAPRALG